MLVLSRHVGETIQLGDDITIQVVSLSGDRVRLGIEAPPRTRIMRGELIESGERKAESGKRRAKLRRT